MSNEREDNIFKKRRCPICEYFLHYTEFVDMNPHLVNVGVWNDDRVAIPCCECFMRLKILNVHSIVGPYVRNFNEYIILHYRDKNHEKIPMTITLTMYKNMEKWGVFDNDCAL